MSSNGSVKDVVVWRGHDLKYTKIDGQLMIDYKDTCIALGVEPQLDRVGKHLMELTKTHRAAFRSMMASVMTQLELAGANPWGSA